MNKKVVSIIELLDEKIEEMPDNYLFNESVDPMEIIDCEVDLDIELPWSYKVFVNNYNGGFICDDSLAKIVRERGDLELAQWNSIHIFGLDELKREYEKLRGRSWKIWGTDYKVYPFIPFCRTAIGELLIFVNPPIKHLDSPVFDAFHEDFPSDWGMLYPGFTEFLEDYINNNGFVPTTSYDSPTASEFLATGKRGLDEERGAPKN